ncbi:DNA helicase rad5, partial [Teratosphaeriaceae sp. CCFEE 6253]
MEVPRCFNCRESVSVRDVFEVVRHEEEEQVAERGVGAMVKGERAAAVKLEGSESDSESDLYT